MKINTEHGVFQSYQKQKAGITCMSHTKRNPQILALQVHCKIQFTKGFSMLFSYQETLQKKIQCSCNFF